MWSESLSNRGIEIDCNVCWQENILKIENHSKVIFSLWTKWSRWQDNWKMIKLSFKNLQKIWKIPKQWISLYFQAAHCMDNVTRVEVQAGIQRIFRGTPQYRAMVETRDVRIHSQYNSGKKINNSIWVRKRFKGLFFARYALEWHCSDFPFEANSFQQCYATNSITSSIIDS